MKVCFVHLGREHLGIEYLSAALKDAGHEIGLAYDPGLFGNEDNVFQNSSLEKMFSRRKQVLKYIQNFNPDLLAFSAYTSTYDWCLQIAREVRKKNKIPTVFGGMHPTLVPDEVIRRDEVDFVIIGEGEVPLKILAENLDSPEKVPNIVLKNGFRGPLIPAVNLENLPLPDKSLFSGEINIHDDCMIMASRGCVYSCSYCCEAFWNSLYDNGFYRRRSVESIISELKSMKVRYGIRRVMFNDALFFTDKEWLRSLLDEYNREIAVPFRCFGKVEMFDREVALMLKKSGCYCIEFGMQTFNQKLKKDVLNRHESNTIAMKAFRLCDKEGLYYDIDHIMGLPGETERDHRIAVKAYSSLHYLNRVKVHNLIYFPSLPIQHHSLKHCLISEEDVELSKRGIAGDFFHYRAVDKKGREKKAYTALMRILPILPARFIRHVLFNGRWKKFALMPGILLVLLQILVAIRGRDQRYIIYIRYYWKRLWKKLEITFDTHDV